MKLAAKCREILERLTGRGVYPHQLAFLLTFPLRRIFLTPRQLVERLALREGDWILELGPGPAYFSREAARAVPAGRLVLMDLQVEMLEKARKRLRRAAIANATYVQGDAGALPFSSGRFDVAFLVTVIGEVGSPETCLRELHRVLRRDGLLSITEQPGDPDFIALDRMEALARTAGFRLEKVYGHGSNYTASFRS